MKYAEVVSILKKARDMALPFYGNIADVRKGDEIPSDVITELDTKIEDFICKELKSKYPNIAFVGEETGGDRTQDWYWLVDPIDGTGHFARGMPFCSVMLALIEEGKVNFGAIVLIANGDSYVAERGQGTTMNGTPIHVNERHLRNGFIGCEMRPEKEEVIEKYIRLKKMAGLFETLCAGFNFCMVAAGKLEGRVMLDPWGKDYDFAPGSLLVEEAGGVVANIGSRSYDFANLDFIAANPIAFRDLAEGKDALFPITQ